MGVRYVRFLLIPTEGELHPIEETIAAEPSLDRVAIHHFRTLTDGTAVTLYELSGDPEAAEGIVADEQSVRSFDISADGRSIYVHTRFEPKELTAAVYDVAERLDLVLDMPMEYTDRGALRITAIGELETFREAMATVPEGVGLRLLETGEYTPEGDQLYDQLTDRQQETLRAAVEAGYYEEPREVTYEEVAERLDVAPGTVGEHLRKVESAVLSSIVP